MKNPFTGVGPFLHDHARDRPLDTFGKKVTIHTGKNKSSYLLLPIIPSK